MLTGQDISLTMPPTFATLRPIMAAWGDWSIMSTSDPSPPPPGASDSALVRVLLVEGAHVVRRGLAVSLVADPTVRLVGAPRRLEEAYHLVPTCLADVVVVGTSLSDIPALAAVGGLRTQFPGVGVILVGAHPNGEELS